MKEIKEELVNELVFLNKLQERAWQYHPNNPNRVSIVDEYAQLQKDIDVVEEKLDQLDI